MAAEDSYKNDLINRTFLLIEDFEAMRGILRDLLRRCGARRIDIAANAKEALSLMRRGKFDVDVVLCDYHLGPGKNGQQLLAEARHEGLISASTIWIMVTAEKTAEMVMGAIEHQPDDYLLKPVTEAALQNRLAKLIKRKAALTEIATAMRAKEYGKALDLCKKRIEQDPGNQMEIMRLQAELFLLLGQPEQARQIFYRVLARRDIPWARLGLAKLLIHECDTEQARELLECLIDDTPNYLESYDLLAQIYRRQGAWQDMQRVLSKAVEISPNSAQRQNALGESALRCENLGLAETAFQRALKLSAQSSLKVATPYLGLARVYSAQNKTADALGLLTRLTADLESDEASLQAKAEEVRVYQRAGNMEAAIAATKTISARIEGGNQNLSPPATLDLAETFMLMGHRETASKLLQFVIRNNHEDAELALRAQEIFDKGSMSGEGRILVQSSRQQAIDAMTQGGELASQGKLEEALAYLNHAKTLMPRNPRLLLNHSHVAISLLQKNGWRHDLETAARRSITTARQVSPGEKRCGELLAKLEALR